MATNKANPTNSDIMQAIGELKGEAKIIRKQVEKTNGRVTKIEEWKNALQAVERYKKENKDNAVAIPMQTNRWYDNPKLVGGVAAVLFALSTLISLKVGG